jgi:hypothetical protein
MAIQFQQPGEIRVPSNFIGDTRYFGSPEYFEFINANAGVPRTSDLAYRSPYFRDGLSSSFGAAQDAAIKKYLDRVQAQSTSGGAFADLSGTMTKEQVDAINRQSEINQNAISNRELLTPNFFYSNPINFLSSAPITPGEPDPKSSQIDASIRPFLTEGLRQAQEIFLRQQPQMFPGQMYVSPSAQTLQSLQMQEDIAKQQSPFLSAGQGAYMQSLGGLSGTAAGQYLNANPYQQQMIAAATRPLTQAYGEQVLPGISSLYSKSGRLGSGSMERALGTATEQFGRSIGDISANIAGTQFQQERGLQQQAALQLANLAQQAPQIYAQQFIPAQQLAQIGAQREAIAAQPLQEQMSRFAYQQRLPYEQLSGYLSSVYGSPLGSFGTPAPQPQFAGNQTIGAIGGGLAGGLGGYALGSMLPSSFLGGYGGLVGGGLGALGGGLLGGGYF